MTILCLTGWQQPHDALANIAPDAVHFDYAAYGNVQTLLAALPKSPRLAIGWSLGGHLLALAIAGGFIKPERLILLSAPYQCLADEHFPGGMPPAILETFIENYTQNPIATLKQFNTLLALGDDHEKTIVRALDKTVQVQDHGLFWLKELQRSSTRGLHFSHFPQTMIVHGRQDKVIDTTNAQAWAERIKGAEVKLLPGCAHAPHLHDPATLTTMIHAYVQ